eukprot:TRINITY_DN23015_c0_g1_i3.p1 TRINITY_DN23015_c0_g1~~TRINITY_DN23015_c0_g1_i3.p1  ORF type:complete len:104 (+),score=23.16 TRINITY_DN23015_c0_g1_i3:100-411(+)
MIRRPPRSTLSSSSAASDVYKRQEHNQGPPPGQPECIRRSAPSQGDHDHRVCRGLHLSLIHISEPTRLLSISYAVFCLKKKKKTITTDNQNSQHKNSYDIIHV